MRTTETAYKDLMAAWRATGGAQPATRRIDENGGDDGLTAGAFTSRSFGCQIDDGLTAGLPSTFGASCFVDDGLTAGPSTGGFSPKCAVDDGLTAGGPSTPGAWCFVDDGLTAIRTTSPFTGC